MSRTPSSRSPSVDPEEVARFSALSESWWDPAGDFRALHRLNPVRLDYIRQHAAAHFGRDPSSARSLEGLRILDIGCGGGILSEPMARLGGQVVGIDPSERNIGTAAHHAMEAGVEVDYRAVTAETLAESGAVFDLVLNMEVVEHVVDVPAFLRSCARMVAPGGLMFVATINRTAKAFALAIVGAEYLLGWLPRGTHSWDKFVRPGELDGALSRAGLRVFDRTGVVYSPLFDEWRTSPDMDVNYMLVAKKAPEAT